MATQNISWLRGNPAMMVNILERETSSLGKYIPYSVVNGQKYRIHHVVWLIIRTFIRGRYKTIVDPTCGVKNHMFSRILPAIKYIGLEYKCCDKNPENYCKQVCDVFQPETLPEGEVYWYDPPFTPHKRIINNRDLDYAIDRERSLNEIRHYYSRRVYENFIQCGAKLIVVKGTDFYIGGRLYLWLHDVVEYHERTMPIGLIIYRYTHYNMPLMNYRISLNNNMRVQIAHTYFLVLQVV